MDAADVRILSGSPDDAELAALVTVLSALAGATRTAGPGPRGPRPRRPLSYPPPTSWRTRR